MLIGVTGCSGSGKSTFVKILMETIGQTNCTLFTQDNYYIQRKLQPKDDKGIHNFDLPESLDLKQFYEDLWDLKNGKTIHQKQYNYNNPNQKVETLVIIPQKIIISEGLFVFYDKEFQSLFDYKLFIDCIPEMSFQRRLERDERERGYGFDDVNYRFHNHVLPSYYTHIEPFKKHCDVIIDNTKNEMNSLKNAVLEFMEVFDK